MPFYKLFLLLLFFLICNKVFPATFTVTSNADAGPGTLRQALLDAAANGTATIDNINFNLPGNSLAAITITVQSQLPDVTANVIIDGTTQPGLPLGVSNARVIITVANPSPNLNAFNVSNLVTANDAVEFYGLYIKGFSPTQRGYGSGIVVGADCKLIIGAPNKGNVISGNWYALSGFFANAKIQSNLIGVASDGITGMPNFDLLYSGNDYNNLLIGGDLPVEGNIIVGGYEDGIDFQGSNSTQQTVRIKNNIFGADYTGTTAISGGYNAFLQAKDPQINLLVTDNVFAANNLAINIQTQGALTVKGNFFGTNKTQTLQLGAGGGGSEAIHIVTNVVATIGGTLASDQNVFAYYNNPIFADNNSSMLIVQNKFYCNNYVSVGNLISNSYVHITDLSNTSISGDASPGALIQLYYANSPSCPNCNPTTWFTNVTANANGRWTYTGNTSQNILASSTVNNNTFGFQRFLLLPADVTIQDYDCHHSGSIKLLRNHTGRITINWKDNNNGQIVATGQQANNLAPGVYNVEISESNTCLLLESGQFTVQDLTTRAYSNNTTLNCTNPTGSLTAYYTAGPGLSVTKIFWEDATGTVISNAAIVNNLAAGKYFLYVQDNNGCTSAKVECDVFPPVATPVIDETHVTHQDATCNNADGSITGITVSNAANASFGWITTDGLHTYPMVKNLLNVPAGQYYFYVNYSFTCPTLKSQVVTVLGINAITLNETAVVKTPSTCSNSNGSITGIVATGQTKYQWFNNATQAIAGTNADLTGVPAGDYYLVASNATCSQKSQVYTVPNTPAVNNYPSTLVQTDAYCNLSNGSLTVSFNSTPVPKSYRWTTHSGTPVIANAPLSNVPAGSYDLYVTDANDCESLYQTYIVNSVAPLVIAANSGEYVDDQCGVGTGSVKNVSVTGGLMPYSYIWLDAKQQIISYTADLTSVKHGTYTLQVKDATGCNLATKSYVIQYQPVTITPPEVDNLQICSPGLILIHVNNPQIGYGYRVYDAASGGNLLGDEASGSFKLTISGSASLFFTSYNGDCESERVEAKLSIGPSTLSIPNTFTPNNDGQNDFWNIKGIESYPNALVQVFNRYGQKVFESRGYNKSFDGRSGASVLPVGVYYYIITLHATCNLLSGSLTIIR